MATTEIQKVPGNFNLPADWPKLEIPDVTSDLLGDWNGRNLEVGPMPGNWGNSISNAAGSFYPFKGGFYEDPVVELDEESGENYIKFTKSRLRVDKLNILQDAHLTIIVTVRPSEPTANGTSTTNTERIISGANGGFRAISRAFDSNTGLNQFRLSVTSRTVNLPAQLSGNTKYSVVGRFTGTTINGKSSIDSEYVRDNNSLQQSVQSYINLGGNDTTNMGTNFRGDVFRVQIWTRLLSDTDVEAVFKENKERFKFS